MANLIASPELRLIIASSPKCASKSIYAWWLRAIETATGKPAAADNYYRISGSAIQQYPDFWKVLFIRDPLRRLVSFYAMWVVRDDTRWCFADRDRRLSLRDKSFRQFLLVLRHLHGHGLDRQHHLVPQLHDIRGLEFDEVMTTDDLAEKLAALNQRLGVSVPVPHINRTEYCGREGTSAADRCPAWLRQHGLPAPEFFYDDETRAIALDAYADDVAFYCAATGRDVCAARG